MSTDRPAREWNADHYDTLSTPLTARGIAVLDRADFRSSDRVLDAGCGTGRVSAALLDRLPEGEVIALDGSAAMVDRARELIGDDPRVTLIQADLGEPLPLAPPVDAAISTSTFHWVPDHPRLYGNLAAVIRPGGHLHVDCGGEGNIGEIVGILGDLGESHPWTFSGVAETESALADAGFRDVRVWLSDDPVDVEPERLEDYLATVILGTHLAERRADEGRELVRRVASGMAAPRFDYVRLNIDARRGGAPGDPRPAGPGEGGLT